MSHPGDLWLLGRHRVLCGSALDDGCYEMLMGKQKAAMVFTDPPYNVPIEGNVSGLGAIHHREFAMASGEMSEAEFTALPAADLHSAREPQRERIDPLHLHGLAPYVRGPQCGPSSLYRT